MSARICRTCEHWTAETGVCAVWRAALWHLGTAIVNNKVGTALGSELPTYIELEAPDPRFTEHTHELRTPATFGCVAHKERS